MAKNRAGPHVPRFGNWDANDHAPYTKVFETARAGRGGRLINPNDPSENPEAFGAMPRPPPPPATVAPKSPSHPRQEQQQQQQQDNPTDPARRSRTEHRIGSREDGEFKKYMESPARYRQSPAMVGRTPSSSDNNRRYNGSDIHRSPLHPQAKIPERNAPALPKFGDWDAKDPSSGEGFTTIFNNARTERAGPGRVPPANSAPGGPDHGHHGYGRGGGAPHSRKQQSWFCCFG